MSPRLRWMLVALGVLVVGIPLAILFMRTHERTTTTEQLPPQGEAAYNPLYVLGQALRADGVRVTSLPRVDLQQMALQPGDTLVLLQDSAELAPSTAQALKAWVARGGHLVVRTPPIVAKEIDRNGTLLDAFGVNSVGFDRQCQPFHVRDDPQHVEFCRGRRFEVLPSDEVRIERRWGDDSTGLVYARLRHARGTLDVAADLEFMQGQVRRSGITDADSKPGGVDGLHDKAHRDLTRQVLHPNYGKGTMWLVYASRPPSLWNRAFYLGWPVWLPLLLALLGWLWARAQRLGSEMPSPAAERRSLLEHVRASGELLLRFGQAPLLYAAVQRAFLQRLRRRAPSAAAQEGDDRVHAIATLLHWPHSRVQTALHPPAAGDTAGLRDRIRLLIQMRNLL